MREILEVACEYLRYDPELGEFRWIKQPNPRGPNVVGAIAGGLNSLGYWQLRLGKRHLYGHQLAWFFVHGYWPKNIDHKNGKPWDNRIHNLRECTQSQNIGNANFGKFRGIELHGAKYRVRIFVRGRGRIEVGSFSTLEQAVVARDAAYDKHFGEHSYFNRS